MSRKLSESEIECLKMALHIDETALLEPNYQLYRLTSQDEGRYYWEQAEDGSIDFYASVTTIIGDSLNSKFLTKWVGSLGNEQAEIERDSAAEYGTAMHALIAAFCIAGEFDLRFLPIWIGQYCEVERPKYPTDHWRRKLTRDLLAWMQFCHDFNVRIIAMEIILRHKGLKAAGAIDALLEMDLHEKGYFGEVYATGANKGQPKETKRTYRGTVILDEKSGRNGFHRSHEIQLAGYRMLVEENYPGLKVDALFNWSPKDWRTSPTYNLVDQTGKATAENFGLRASLFWEENGDISTRREVTANPVLKLGTTAEGILKSVSLQEYMRDWHNKQVVEQAELEADETGGPF